LAVCGYKEGSDKVYELRSAINHLLTIVKFILKKRES